MFDSCSAYQNSEDLLFLSHCVPNPPDKGEKIRSYHEIHRLARDYRVHLACFARTDADIAAAEGLRGICATVYVERHKPKLALARAGAHFLRGGCLTRDYYLSAGLKNHVTSLAPRLRGAFAFSSAMAQYAPSRVPLLLDMVDVDSEKWFDYGRLRRPGFPFRMEGHRLRKIEVVEVRRAACTLVATARESALLCSFAPAANVRVVENGVDTAYFQPVRPYAVAGPRAFVFVGAMDYYPNSDAVRWFAANVFPEARRRNPLCEFYIVGRNPTPAVRALGNRPGIVVTGEVEDVRPYFSAARAVIAPIRIVRGIQNKVLQALAMGKCVLASPEIGETFGSDLPDGLIRCNNPEDYLQNMSGTGDYCSGERIRACASKRFCWDRSMEVLAREVSAIAAPNGVAERVTRR